MIVAAGITADGTKRVLAAAGCDAGPTCRRVGRRVDRRNEILREEIARTVANPADVADEVRALFAALA
jgi:hypothetical protein